MGRGDGVRTGLGITVGTMKERLKVGETGVGRGLRTCHVVCVTGINKAGV